MKVSATCRPAPMNITPLSVPILPLASGSQMYRTRKSLSDDFHRAVPEFTGPKITK